MIANNIIEKSPDPLHNIGHVNRVLKLLDKFVRAENSRLNFDVIIPAIYFHDIWVGSKNTTNNIFVANIPTHGMFDEAIRSPLLILPFRGIVNSTRTVLDIWKSRTIMETYDQKRSFSAITGSFSQS